MEDQDITSRTTNITWNQIIASPYGNVYVSKSPTAVRTIATRLRNAEAKLYDRRKNALIWDLTNYHRMNNRSYEMMVSEELSEYLDGLRGECDG